MTLQVPPSAYLFPSLVIAVVLMLILLFLLLIFMKRPSPSRESSGAIALTIAAVILLSGVWCIWLSPTYTTRRYEEVVSRSFTVKPSGVVTQTFRVERGQKVEVSLSHGGPVRIESIPSSERRTYPVFTVKVYDPRGRLVWSQVNVSKYLIFTLDVEESGSYRVEVGNPQDERVSLTLRVQDRTKVTIRPLEPVGQWLSLISLPIFGLGVWFIAPRRRVSVAEGHQPTNKV